MRSNGCQPAIEAAVRLGQMEDIALAVAGILGSIVVFAAIFFLVARSAKKVHGRVHAFIDTLRPGRLLADGVVVPGQETTFDAPSEGTPRLWLDYLVTPVDGTSWRARVHLALANGAASREDTFEIGYDGDSHQGSPNCGGVIALPRQPGDPAGPRPPGSDAGLFPFGDVPMAPAAGGPAPFRGAEAPRIRVRCRIDVATAVRAASFRLLVALPADGYTPGKIRLPI